MPPKLETLTKDSLWREDTLGWGIQNAFFRGTARCSQGKARWRRLWQEGRSGCRARPPSLIIHKTSVKLGSLKSKARFQTKADFNISDDELLNS